MSYETEREQRYTLISKRIDEAYCYFFKQYGYQPNMLVIHPEKMNELTEDLFQTGMMNYENSRDLPITYHGMNIYISYECDGFRIGYGLQKDG